MHSRTAEYTEKYDTEDKIDLVRCADGCQCVFPDLADHNGIRQIQCDRDHLLNDHRDPDHQQLAVKAMICFV